MPHQVSVQCPACGQCASFEFAEVVRIQLKKDVAFFQDSPQFDYQLFHDSCGHRWHGAVFYAGLHGDPVKAISSLPEGYSPEDWRHSQYLYRSHGLDIGSVSCEHCHTRRKHDLSWPKDAFFSVSYKGQNLWAFDRESAIDLRDFIMSKHRSVENYKWRNFLLHVPSVFLKQGARSNVAKLLNRVLA